VIDEEGAITGYIVWSLVQAEAHARITLVVRELVAANDRAKRHLFALLGAQRDQVDTIAMDVRADDPIVHALLDVDRGRYGTADVEHALGEVASGPMVRLVDVKRALEARGYAEDGEVSIGVAEPREAFRIRAQGGRATVEPIPYGQAPMLLLDRAALGAMVYGGLSPSDAVCLGWMEPTGSSAAFENAVALADGVFRIPPYFSFDPF
jgi:predicted acetyltransferase